MRSLRNPARELRNAIDQMPIDTRRAMLDAIGLNAIIVGGYTSPDGGVCPMLAAHRNGGRTSFATFAVAWDRYTSAPDRPRPATERELTTLRTMLEASIALEDVQGAGALGRAIASHRKAQRTRALREEHDAPRRRSGRSVRAWTGPFKRVDEYERALSEIEHVRAEEADRLTVA